MENTALIKHKSNESQLKKAKAEKEEEKSPLKIPEKEIEDSNSNGENVEKSIKSYYFKIAFLF